MSCSLQYLSQGRLFVGEFPGTWDDIREYALAELVRGHAGSHKIDDFPKAPLQEMVLREQIYIQVNEGRGEKQKFLQINKSVDSKQ